MQWDTAKKSLEELEASLSDETLPADEVRDRRRVVRQWKENQQYRDLFTTAITLYDGVMSRFFTSPNPSGGQRERG